MVIDSIEDCRNYIEKLNSEYFEKHIKEQERDELINENFIEKRDVKGYHGREILELLQNADDAYQKSIDNGEKPDCELDIKIKYIDNILTISNTGSYFDRDGIKAIVQGNNSPKKGRYIGSKGTGFRSILNWAKEIKIFSGNFNVRFSEENAKNFFDKIKDYPQIKKQLERNKNLYIPILSVPEYIEKEKTNKQTVIEIIVDENKINDDYNVDNQLNSIDSKILLFLPNTNSITIETKEQKIVYCREKIKNESFIIDGCIDSMSLVTIKKFVDSNEELSEDYELFEKTIKDKYIEDGDSKDVILAIAVPFNKSEVDSYLYTYFPLLETKNPFNCIMHATYSLGDQRNTIIVNSNNKEIVIEQLKFLVDIADNYYINNKKYIEALNLLTPKNIYSYYNFSFETGFARFKVEDEYINLIKDLKIFLNVNGELLSFNDDPIILKSYFPKFIKGEYFNDLIDKSINNEAEKLLKFIAKSGILNEYKEEDLCNKISNLSNSLTVPQRVECFNWWEENYSNYLPQLIKDQNDRWINKNDECYFLDGDFDDVEIPKWIKVPSIDLEYQSEIFKIAEKRSDVIEYKKTESQISRIISINKIYKLINFRYKDKSTIISTINSSVDNYSKAIYFVKWLWKYYKDDEQWTPPNIQTIKYKFPTIDGSVDDNINIYLGQEYGNVLSEKLFDKKYKKMPPLETFGIDISELDNFKLFISKFLIFEYPPILYQQTDICSEYRNYLITEMKKNFIFVVKSLDVTIKTIDNFYDIINRLNTYEIIQWIKQDKKLFSELSIKKYDSRDNSYRIEYLNNKNNKYTFTSVPIENYLLFVLNNTKWIEIEGNKYAPNEILFDDTLKANQIFKELIPVISSDYIKHLQKYSKIEYEDLMDIFNLFSFCHNVSELSSNDFYGLLLEIPKCNEEISIKMSRHIYRLFEKFETFRIYDNSANKTKFFNEGKLLTQNGKYVLATEVYYPSTLIVNKKQYNVLDKSQRNGQIGIFMNIFNCKEYDLNPIVDKGSIILHKDDYLFQKELLEFKKYAIAYEGTNKEIDDNLNKLTIKLVSKITTSINGNKDDIQDEYVQIRETQTKWYISLFGDYDRLNISCCLENILSNIANSTGFNANKYGELFRSDKVKKEFLIKKDCGNCDFIKDITFGDELKKEFFKAIKAINPYFEENSQIDFDNIDDEDTIDAIIDCLKQNGIENINDLYNNGFTYKIDLNKYYQAKVKHIKNQNEQKYLNYLFDRAKTNEQYQNTFLNDYYRFKSYNIDENIDNICDINDILIQEFGEWNDKEYSDAIQTYTNNYKIINPNNLFANEINNDDKVKQWIYFNNIEKFNDWIKKQEIEKDDEKIELSDESLDIIPIRQDIEYNSNISSVSSKNAVKRDFMYVAEHEETKRKRNKQKGNKGEKLIFNLLNSEGKKVIPVSEAFVELGLLPAGLGKSGDYDMMYEDPITHEKVFVEVKTGDSNSFYITSAELEFAKECPKNYKLFVVYDLDSDKPKCMELPEEFWNDERYKIEPIIKEMHVKF